MDCHRSVRTFASSIAILSPVAAIEFGSAVQAKAEMLNRPRHASAANACPAPVPCQTKEVNKVVMVPTWVTEDRVVRSTEYRPQRRERTYTVCHRVPVVET